MRVCYALRRGVFYPSQRDEFGTMPPREFRAPYLEAVGRLGFPAVEIGADERASDDDVSALRDELYDAGIHVACVRAGGSLAHPQSGPAARKRMECAIRQAALVQAEIVNTALVSPPTHPGGPGNQRQGETVSQGASRTASEADFEAMASHLRRYGEMAASLGVKISIEVHQGSIADNSWATVHLLDLVGLPNVGANPDLGNIYWHYEYPEETAEAAIVALAPRAVYWHCKNLHRIHIPELHRSVYQRVALPDGDLDYRFAIAAMQAAGYDGYLAIEGIQHGDQLTQDGRSLRYVQELMGE